MFDRDDAPWHVSSPVRLRGTPRLELARHRGKSSSPPDAAWPDCFSATPSPSSDAVEPGRRPVLRRSGQLLAALEHRGADRAPPGELVGDEAVVLLGDEPVRLVRAPKRVRATARRPVQTLVEHARSPRSAKSFTWTIRRRGPSSAGRAPMAAKGDPCPAEFELELELDRVGEEADRAAPSRRSAVPSSASCMSSVERRALRPGGSAREARSRRFDGTRRITRENQGTAAAARRRGARSRRAPPRVERRRVASGS